ncbi:MAG: acetyl-CoA carboxylase carboxyltransferase subunit alpha [Clostridiales bacterium]|nr:acetyl-CoA carboxylase carboxyltransferase subunit alpha [Clostridiales bacterium]
MTDKLTPWDRVKLARKIDRPTSSDYISKVFDSFIELHGDRYYGDDSAVVAGIAKYNYQSITVIAQQKGKNIKENKKRNYGMPKPEGYRKALRLMKQAEKFKRPIILLIDTPGAFCGIEAEERGQGEAIAKNLYEMSSIKVPILSIVIGEGGSGGALAFGVSNEVWMLKNSIYSVISPEGFASIIWKDGKRAPEAADLLKLTAHDLIRLKIIDKVIDEPDEFTVDSMDNLVNDIKTQIQQFLDSHIKMTEEEIVSSRYNRFRTL